MASLKTLTVGAAATDLDIFIRESLNSALLDPSGLTFRIFDYLNVEAVTEVSGAKIDIGHYTASGAIIPQGYSLGGPWEIRWDVVLPGGASGQFIEEFNVVLPSLAVSFSSSVDNSVETLFDRVRIDIGDPNGTIFSDGLLSRILQKSITRLNRRLGLVRLSSPAPYLWIVEFVCGGSAGIPNLSVDLLAGTISPNSDPYADLVVLQMEEILLQSESIALQRLNANTAGSFGSGLQGVSADGVSVTNVDGVTITKSIGRLSHRADLTKFNLGNISKMLEDGIKDIKWRLSGAHGIDVTMPRYHWRGLYQC